MTIPDETNWHDPVPSRALIVAACLSACVVGVGIIAALRWAGLI